MPRGVPNKGYRETDPTKQAWRPENQVFAALQGKVPFHALPDHNPDETIEQADARIKVRFGILAVFTDASTTGDCRALIVSGPPGLGKSYTVEQVLKGMDSSNYELLKGYVKTTGLIRAIYDNRKRGQLIVLDDCDMIFKDENSLNLLKAVCDTCETRHVTYKTEADMVSERDGDIIPKSFIFDGSVIFLTNLDFDAMIARGHALSEHLSALVSRSHYIDLSMKSKRDFLIRIQQVMAEGLLNPLPRAQQDEVYDWIVDNKDSLRELSLRMAIKVANVRRTMPSKWKDIANVTCCRV